MVLGQISEPVRYQIQRKAIKKLRDKGAGYKAIAQKLDLSVNTVKSYCRRNGLTGNRSGTAALEEIIFCKECGKKLTQTDGAKKKTFCSDECRLSWWKRILLFIYQHAGISVDSHYSNS